MKIIGLRIKKLYGHFNYEDIRFNDDITFLYGLNGSGKTTVLNILEIILSGQLYRLFEYDFERINLNYRLDQGKETKEISILNFDEEVVVTYEKDTYKIPKYINPEYSEKYIAGVSRVEAAGTTKNRRELYYYKKFPVLEKIQNDFNYVYLPLDRISKMNNITDEDKYIYKKASSIRIDERKNNKLFDRSMRDIERLVEEISSANNFKIRRIDTNFQSKVLRSLINVKISDESDVIKNLVGKDKIKAETILDIQKQYTDILSQLGLLTLKQEKTLEKFFNNLLYNLVDFEKKPNSLDVQTLLSLNEVNRIRDIVSLAEESEDSKNKINYPIELFLKTVNEFTNSGMDSKKIQIVNGRIFFTTHYSSKKIPIHFLSSGEKQLLSFFANLIFRMKNKRSIYIVDEPELSLHLSWQNKFVETILQVSNEVQFVFATHAPEIISYRRDKMVRLSKDYVD